MSYRTTNRDRSHVKIVHELRAMGFSVADLASIGMGIPDILIASKHCTALVEIKEPDGILYLSQLLFIANWKGNALIAQTSDEITRAIAYDAFLTAKEKERVLEVVTKYAAKSKAKRPKISVSLFEKEMNERS